MQWNSRVHASQDFEDYSKVTV